MNNESVRTEKEGGIPELLRRMIGEEAEKAFPGAEVAFPERIRENGVRLTGVTIRYPDQTFIPVIYPDTSPCMENEAEAEKEAQHIISQYRRMMEHPYDPSGMFEDAEEKLEIHVVNSALNAERLKDAVRQDLGEVTLFLFFRVFQSGGMTVNPTILQKMRLGEAEAWEIAVRNMRKKRKTGFLHEVLEEMDPGTESPEGRIYMITTDTLQFGASVFFIDREARRVCREKLGGDYYAMPASIHEILAVPAADSDPAYLLQTVADANRETVGEADYLSSCIFFVGEDLEWRVVAPETPGE